MSFSDSDLNECDDISADSEPEDLQPVSSDSSVDFHPTETSTPSTRTTTTPAVSEDTPVSIRQNEGTFLTLLRESNTLLKSLESRLLRLESKVADITNPQAGSGSSAPPKKNQIIVSDQIRRDTRRIYKVLLSSTDDSTDNSFEGWDLGSEVTLNNERNQKVIRALVQEVRKVHPGHDSSAVEAAAKRYYRTCREQYSRDRRGKSQKRKEERRKDERIMRKRKQRAAALEKTTMSESSKGKWRKIVNNTTFMSSEESGEEDNVKILLKRPLPFRSEKVSTLFNKLDELSEGEKKSSALSVRMAIKRKTGSLSSRQLPEGHNFPAWAISS